MATVWYALHGHAPDDVTGHRTRARWYTTKTEPSYDDMAVKLRRVIIAARFRGPCPEQVTPQETRAVLAAWPPPAHDQQRLRNTRAAKPAAYVLFDLLARNGKDLRDRPYWKRRRKLEKLIDGHLPDGLVLTPATPDPAVARSWMLAHTGNGLEGVVAKRLDQPYRPRQRGWQKLRTHITVEAVVGV